MKKFKNVFIVGIKGVALTAFSELLIGRGCHVEGSDTSEVFFTDKVLRDLGVSVHESFDPALVTEVFDALIYSTAYDPYAHEQILQAKKLGIPVHSYPETLAQMVREKMSIAVCGSHGKTTTTALLAFALEGAGMDPSALVGSHVSGWRGGAKNGGGAQFVFEADEYQNKLTLYDPWSVIVTNIDWDHPDSFPTKESYIDAFRTFVAKVGAHGLVVVCGDDAQARSIIKDIRARVITFGFGKQNDYRLSEPEDESSPQFTVTYQGKVIESFTLRVPGNFNILNAGGAIALTHAMKLNISGIKRGIEAFGGTARRFESVGVHNGALLIDDYAHHPSEIRATLLTARKMYRHKRIIAIFQPHTYTRTEALFEGFVYSFRDADELILLDIYSSAREEKGTVLSQDIADRVNAFAPGKARVLPKPENVVEYLSGKLSQQDVVITLGAGNGWEVVKTLATS